MNQIILDGTVFEPAYKKTQSGKDLLSFNLSFFNGKDGDKSTYGNIRVVAFGDLAVNAWKTLHERDKVKVAGRLRHDVWEKDGVKHYDKSIMADAIDKRISTFPESGRVADEEIPF